MNGDGKSESRLLLIEANEAPFLTMHSYAQKTPAVADRSSPRVFPSSVNGKLNSFSKIRHLIEQNMEAIGMVSRATR